jgi:hypothetical protein
MKLPDLTLYELARRNMIAFSEYYVNHTFMSKDEWFKIQKQVLVHCCVKGTWLK